MNIKNENAIGDDERDNAAGSDGPGWLEACRREEAIRKLLGRSDGERLKVGDVEEVALELGVSRATLYRLITARKRRGGRGTAPAASLPPVVPAGNLIRLVREAESRNASVS